MAVAIDIDADIDAAEIGGIEPDFETALAAACAVPRSPSRARSAAPRRRSPPWRSELSAWQPSRWREAAAGSCPPPECRIAGCIGQRLRGRLRRMRMGRCVGGGCRRAIGGGVGLRRIADAVAGLRLARGGRSVARRRGGNPGRCGCVEASAVSGVASASSDAAVAACAVAEVLTMRGLRRGGRRHGCGHRAVGRGGGFGRCRRRVR